MLSERLFVIGAVTVCLAFGAIAGTAGAATFVVDSTDEDNDHTPGNGICEAWPGGPCTLRAAVIEANNWPGADIIEVPGGVYELTRIGPGEDNAQLGDLDILEALTIRGEGMYDSTIDGT